MRDRIMQATTKDLRLHTAEVLAATDRGESVIITFRGERRAILQRWSEETTRARERNPAFGLWSEHDQNVEEMVRQLRSGRQLP